MDKLDPNIEQAFMRTMKRQEISDKISENRAQIKKLGQKISQSAEMKEIKSLSKHNRNLGQQISILQAEIDRIIVEAEEMYRKSKK